MKNEMSTTTPNAILIDAITILPGRREIREEEVQTIAESMATIGLQTPITVRRNGEKYILVTGAHRLAAARKLEWTVIDCVVRDFASDADARLWEISENLHRAGLTVLERAEYVAEWERLNEGMATPKQVSQVGTPVEKHGHRQPESGVRKTAKALGISKSEVQRARKIASLSPKVKAAAVKAGKANNQAALLKAADFTPEDDPIARFANSKPTPEPTKAAKPSKAAMATTVTAISADCVAAHRGQTPRAPPPPADTDLVEELKTVLVDLLDAVLGNNASDDALGDVIDYALDVMERYNIPRRADGYRVPRRVDDVTDVTARS
jgi:ParB-like nuclease domain